MVMIMMVMMVMRMAMIMNFIIMAKYYNEIDDSFYDDKLKL